MVVAFVGNLADDPEWSHLDIAKPSTAPPLVSRDRGDLPRHALGVLSKFLADSGRALAVVVALGRDSVWEIGLDRRKSKIVHSQELVKPEPPQGDHVPHVSRIFQGRPGVRSRTLTKARVRILVNSRAEENGVIPRAERPNGFLSVQLGDRRSVEPTLRTFRHSPR